VIASQPCTKHRTATALRVALVALVLVGVPLATPAAQADVPSTAASVGDGWDGLNANVPGGFPSWNALFEVQNKMHVVVDEVRAAAQAARSSGFTNAITAPERREVLLYWKGALPGAVEKVIDARRGDMPVRVIPARYSEAELLPEVERIGRDPRVTEAYRESDGSGITVVLLGRQLDGATGNPAWLTSSIALKVFDGGVRGVPMSRQDDSPPWYAGARTTICTTGFAVTAAGISSLLFAAHCGTQTVKDPAGQTIGTVFGTDWNTDTQLIRADSSPKTWDGPVNSDYRKSVQGSQPSSEGDWLCTSGAWSGVRCGVQVRRLWQSFDGVYPLVMSEQVDGRNAGGQGDSGGPVFTLPAPDNGKVIAKGIMSRGDRNYLVACTGLTVGPDAGKPRLCFKRLYYVDVNQTLIKYGATLKTE
jgi:hypothetical protein